MLELIYTSSPSGLRPGRSGFTSVAWTWGMPPLFIAPLENLSAYRQLFMPEDERYPLNPVVFAFIKLRVGQEEYPVVSRISACGLDYTGRTNKIAHHIVCESSDEDWIREDGPVSLFLAEKNNFCAVWDKTPQLLPPRFLNRGRQILPHPADAWQREKGDAGWAGVIARCFLNSRQSGKTESLYLSYPSGTPAQTLLELTVEVIRLLPQKMRRDFTFNTCFLQDSKSAECFFRMGLDDSPLLQAAARVLSRNFIVLEKREAIPPEYEGDPLVAFARSGEEPLPQKKSGTTIPLPDTPLPSPEPERFEKKVSPRPPDVQKNLRKTAAPPLPPPKSPSLPSAEPPLPASSAGRGPVFRKWIFFLIFFLIVGGGSVLVWRLMDAKEKSQEKEIQPQPETHSASPGGASMEKTEGKSHAGAVPAENRAGETASPSSPASEKTKPPSPVTHSVPPEESFSLFADAVYGNSPQEVSLPASWGNIRSVSVKRISGNDWPGGEKCLPAPRSTYKDIVFFPESQLLRVTESRQELGMIAQLVFTDENGHCREMPFGFRPEYADFFHKKIRFAGYSLEVTNGEYENRYSFMVQDYLNVPNIVDFSSFASNVKLYNKSLAEEKAAEEKLRNLQENSQKSRQLLEEKLSRMEVHFSGWMLELPKKKNNEQTAPENMTLSMMQNAQQNLSRLPEEEKVHAQDLLRFFCAAVSFQNPSWKNFKQWEKDIFAASGLPEVKNVSLKTIRNVEAAILFSTDDETSLLPCLHSFNECCGQISENEEILGWCKKRKKFSKDEIREVQKARKDAAKAYEKEAEMKKKTKNLPKKTMSAQKNLELAGQKIGLEPSLLTPCFDQRTAIPENNENIRRALQHAAEKKLKFTLKKRGE